MDIKDTFVKNLDPQQQQKEERIMLYLLPVTKIETFSVNKQISVSKMRLALDYDLRAVTGNISCTVNKTARVISTIFPCG